MDTKYKSHSFVKLWIATTIFILCCFTTDMSAQNAAAADTVAAVTETITEVVAAPAEEASAAPDTVGELALGLNTVWMLLAAMLVFFMQPGFALVEAGFTRVKNTANILMKNFVDFMFGSLLYWFIGFGLMFGAGGFIGMPHFCDLSFINNGLPTEGFLIFQTVFCATAATIVSGAMAERTKFSMYIVYTIFISVLIYPISGHWTWGGGWLMNGEEGFGDAGGFGGNAGGFSDFFEELFGHRGAGAGSRRGAGFRGQDYNAELQLSLREAAVTHKQVLNVNGKNIRITVPAGIANGQTIKLRGHGAPGVNGGPDGDLYITFIIPDDPVFKRLGNDLYVTAPLNLYTAVLGGEETVDTLDGKVKLKVKPETQNGTKVRLKGKGFPVYKEEGKFGDLIVTYNITIPTNLTEHQKELFRQLKNSIN